MLALDASAIIHAWENYPKQTFPKLWEWLATEIRHGELCILNKAFDEVNHNSPDCAKWLKENSINKIPSNNDEIALKALEIKNWLGIEKIKKTTKGVDENDIFIIAHASCTSCTLLTEEASQPKLPDNKENYKIPAVCKHHGVEYKSFIQFIKDSNQIF